MKMRKLFVNGHIFTSNEAQLYADAMLVENGRIRWIGEQRLAGPLPEHCETIDLQGRTVIPGLIDAHMHPLMLAEYSRQIACLPPKINSLQELTEEIARVRAEILGAAGSPGAPEASGAPAEHGGAAEDPAGQLPWICGWGYDEGKYEEHRAPNRYDLDRGSPDLPVFLVRSCEHIRCVNSKALQIAGITKDTPDPPGGSIDRDENGEPTGILRENARDLVIPYMPVETEEEIVDALTEL
ncbi:MAG: amidohydrolase family protein, partial [Bacillota bacterium]|nr:amidohydrolase family protein [Bacillota bacterium]